MQDDSADDDEGSDTDVDSPVRSVEWDLRRVLWELDYQVRNTEGVYGSGCSDVHATESRFRSPLSPVLAATIQGVIVRVRELVTHVLAETTD